MTTSLSSVSLQMETVITQLARAHGVDLSQQGASLSLAMPTCAERWIITNLDGTRISVTRCVVEDGDCLGLELDMVFLVQSEGWEPVELVYTPTLWRGYRQVAKNAAIPIYHVNGDICFASFTEYWARQLEVQGWLTQAYKVVETAGNDLQGRFPDCQSTHTGPCYGEVWQCSTCGKTVCYAEGTDNHPEVCDDCWVKQYGDQEGDDVPF
jgi:hypothetical protein